jgi:7-cyano-7-deazaguanine synthase
VKVVVLFSGGLDSTVLLYHLRAEGHEVKALSADYGQRHHARELNAGEAICRGLGVERRVVDLTGPVGFFGSNALTDEDQKLPEGEYRAETLPLTTVPNRNMVLLSVGIAWAASLRFDAVAFGAHAATGATYPDCRPGFADAMDRAAQMCDYRPIRVLAPFVTWVKAEIVRRGVELGVPFELTWSCYAGGERPCGRCGTCEDRRAAFAACGLRDPAD